MVLYVMNGMQWSPEIVDFSAWSVRYRSYFRKHISSRANTHINTAQKKEKHR